MFRRGCQRQGQRTCTLMSRAAEILSFIRSSLVDGLVGVDSRHLNASCVHNIMTCSDLNRQVEPDLGNRRPSNHTQRRQGTSMSWSVPLPSSRCCTESFPGCCNQRRSRLGCSWMVRWRTTFCMKDHHVYVKTARCEVIEKAPHHQHSHRTSHANR